jgi:hypothetical protein
LSKALPDKERPGRRKKWRSREEGLKRQTEALESLPDHASQWIFKLQSKYQLINIIFLPASPLLLRGASFAKGDSDASNRSSSSFWFHSC